MNFNTSMTDKTERLEDHNSLSGQWKALDWKYIEKEVNRLQTRIAKATIKGDWNKVERLQYLLTNSFYAKACAVKKVTSNRGKRTSGIDKKLWSNDASKMRATLSITNAKYKAKPLRRTYIDKKGKNKKRPLGIPTMYDRAMQKLHALALEPVAEVIGDDNSYGFRKGRSAKDACERIFNVLSTKVSATWILEGDIKGCFDNINHEWIQQNISMNKKVMRQFLKAGYVHKGKLFPTTNGTPQGGLCGARHNPPCGQLLNV